MTLGNRQTNRSVCLEQFFILDKASFKKIKHVSVPSSFREVVHADKSADTKIKLFFFSILPKYGVNWKILLFDKRSTTEPPEAWREKTFAPFLGYQ